MGKTLWTKTNTRYIEIHLERGFVSVEQKRVEIVDDALLSLCMMVGICHPVLAMVHLEHRSVTELLRRAETPLEVKMVKEKLMDVRKETA